MIGWWIESVFFFLQEKRTLLKRSTWLQDTPFIWHSAFKEKLHMVPPSLLKRVPETFQNRYNAFILWKEYSASIYSAVGVQKKISLANASSVILNIFQIKAHARLLHTMCHWALSSIKFADPLFRFVQIMHCALIVPKLWMHNLHSSILSRIRWNLLNSIMGCRIRSNGFNYRCKHTSPPPVINYTSRWCVPVESLGYEASCSNRILWPLIILSRQLDWCLFYGLVRYLILITR